MAELGFSCKPIYLLIARQQAELIRVAVIAFRKDDSKGVGRGNQHRTQLRNNAQGGLPIVSRTSNGTSRQRVRGRPSYSLIYCRFPDLQRICCSFEVAVRQVPYRGGTAVAGRLYASLAGWLTQRANSQSRGISGEKRIPYNDERLAAVGRPVFYLETSSTNAPLPLVVNFAESGTQDIFCSLINGQEKNLQAISYRASIAQVHLKFDD